MWYLCSFKSKKLIHLVCFCMILLCACSGENVSEEKKTAKLPTSEYAMTKVELPFDTSRLNYGTSAIHDNYLSMFMVENGWFQWYVFDMNTETWEEKEFVWDKHRKSDKFSFRGQVQYDSKGNLYGTWADNSQPEEKKYDIYKMNEDGTLECYVKFSDYISDYKDIADGWKFLDDDRVLVSVEYEASTKARSIVIIDPVKHELHETMMEEISMFYNLQVDGSEYVYPMRSEDGKLAMRVGDMWDYKKKQAIQSDVELDDEDASAITLPLIREEKSYFSFSKHGVYEFTLEDEKMKCVVPSEVTKTELSKYPVYTDAYKAEDEEKYFIVAQDDTKADLYKID